MDLAQGEDSEVADLARTSLKGLDVRIARTFLDAFRETHPDTAVEELDLWDGTLPEFGPTPQVVTEAFALADGAVGMSTGLIYPPSAYGTTDEIVALSDGRFGFRVVDPITSEPFGNRVDRIFDVFLDRHPEFHEDITFFALLQPTRQDVDEYVESLADMLIRQARTTLHALRLERERRGTECAIVKRYVSSDMSRNGFSPAGAEGETARRWSTARRRGSTARAGRSASAPVGC